MAFTDADVLKAVELTDVCQVGDPEEVLKANLEALRLHFEQFDEADSWEISRLACHTILNRSQHK